MADNRKKASMSQVLTDIKPYITKKFMAAPCVKEHDIQAICQILLPRYKNVQLMQGLTNNKPDFRIQVKGLFGTEENYVIPIQTVHHPNDLIAGFHWLDQNEQKIREHLHCVIPPYKEKAQNAMVYVEAL